MTEGPPSAPGPVWWDGRLLPEAQALVPTASQGWLWGRGLFETIAVRSGQPFALTRHLARLRDGAARLRLQLPDDSALRHAIAAVLTHRPPGLHRLRLTLTGGETPGLSLPPEPGHLLIRLTPAAPTPPEATLLTVPWRRNEFSPLIGLKSTSYAENALAHAWAQDRGATDALLLNTAGHLCEAATANLFLVHQGHLLTPPLSSGCLPGITRALLLHLAGALPLPVIERPLTPADLALSSEIFLTTAIRGIHPVAAVDHHPFKAPGPVTAQLTQALADLFQRHPDP